MNARIVVVGSGGNVGSHLVMLLARMTEIGSLVLVDPDVYEEKNLLSQHINQSHVGRSKVEVQAELLDGIRTDLEVIPLKAWLEDLPLGRLRGDLVVSCLDSRLARRQLNARVLALGSPLLDCGVDGAGLQWQVSFFNAKQTGVCIECTWSDSDYDLLEQVSSCKEGIESTPTNATAALGSMAASYIALKCREFLRGVIEPKQFFSRQSRMMIGQEVWRSIRYQPAANCRAEQHEPWEIKQLTRGPDELTVAQALALGSPDPETAKTASLEVPGKSFHVRLTCSVCERDEPNISLFINRHWPLPNCPDCDGISFATGDDLQEELSGKILNKKLMAGSLAEIGLRPGEIFRTTQGETVWHFELPLEPVSEPGADHPGRRSS